MGTTTDRIRAAPRTDDRASHMTGSSRHENEEKGDVAVVTFDPPQVLHDIELERGTSATSTPINDTDLVDWNGSSDPADPKNWSTGAKWNVTLLMSAYSLVTLISSSMIAPALPAIATELDIHNDVEIQLVFSSFILASAVGPIIFAPLSEIYGRKVVTQSGNAFYLVWTIVCGFATSKSVMILGRFLSGLGASVVFGVQYGLLSDCWRASERGKSLAIMNFAPLLGPALGPIFGGFIVQATTWRWIFWAIAIFDGALQLVATFLLWETYGPVLLARKAHALRTAGTKPHAYTVFDSPDRSPSQILRTSLLRPLRILFTHPVAAMLTVYGCISFGTLYVLLSSFASLWILQYGQSASDSGLHYLALVIGFTGGSITAAWGMDRLWARAKHPTPELRCVFLAPCAAGSVVGLLVYGWGAQAKVHWIVPDIGAVLFGFSAQLGTAAVGAYLTDTYGRFTASASGGSFAIRSLCAFGFPLFAPRLYASLGYGWGNSVLALVCAAAGAVVPILVWKFGVRWRARIRLE